MHIAPAFGEDDMNLGKKENLPFIQHVSMDGTFKKEVTDFAGLRVRKKDFPEEADIEIIKYSLNKFVTVLCDIRCYLCNLEISVFVLNFKFTLQLLFFNLLTRKYYIKQRHGQVFC